jgi:soluble lytic murein transglycosylase
MHSLSRELVDLRSAMNIDSVRQYKLQKILTIIEKFNPDLSSSDAYDIANEIYEMSVKYTNLDEDLLCAVITHESARTWDARVVSSAGAMGLMQIMPVTGFFLAEYEGISWTSPEDVIFNPIYNIRMGARYLSMLSEQYGLDGALAAYNGGERQAALWLANGKDDKYLWAETRQYIPLVMKLYDSYQTLGL